MRYLVPDRLAFLSAPVSVIDGLNEMYKDSNLLFMSSDLHHQYTPFAADFGPVNLGIIHRFCSAIQKKLDKEPSKVLVYCFETSFEAQSNASFLLGTCLMLLFGWSAEDAAAPFTCTTAPFTLRPFRDATFKEQTYNLSLKDCLCGLERSISKGWFSLAGFDRRQYDQLEHPLAGDIHEISPKFVAFKGPLGAGSRHMLPGEIAFPPEFYAPTLERLGVTCVVRLNDADAYDAGELERRGIRHHDLFFDDCAVPSAAVARRFFAICDAAEGRVAVHCRAGLGRTGTLIALWLMRREGFGAAEAMGWLRIVRPGSVIGRQQEYLLAVEARGRAEGGGEVCCLDYPATTRPEEVASAAAAAAAAAAESCVRSGPASSGHRQQRSFSEALDLSPGFALAELGVAAAVESVGWMAGGGSRASEYKTF
jgi:cell division cycle 14